MRFRRNFAVILLGLAFSITGVFEAKARHRHHHRAVQTPVVAGNFAVALGVGLARVTQRAQQPAPFFNPWWSWQPWVQGESWRPWRQSEATAPARPSSRSVRRRHHPKVVSHHTKVARQHVAARASGGIIGVETAAGVIRVAASLADKFKDLIADFATAGYHPAHVGCFATGGHVTHSRHYHGGACDFDQHRHGTAAFMRGKVAATIIARYGLRNGCSFADCGHVDDGARVGHRHYARRHHARYAGA